MNDAVTDFNELVRTMQERPTIRDWVDVTTAGGKHTRLKACWEVWAGLHPGHYIDGTAKRWLYTSDDLENDRTFPGPVTGDYEPQQTLFTTYLKAAHLYAQQLTDPARCNFVQVHFLWL